MLIIVASIATNRGIAHEWIIPEDAQKPTKYINKR